MTRQVGIFGASGMAREAGDIAWALGLEPIYVARDEEELRNSKLSGRVIVEDDIKQYADIPFVVGIGDNEIREAISKRYREALKFISLIHPDATFGRDQRDLVGRCKGTIVAAGVRFTNGIYVGDFCIFNQNVTVAHDCVIEDYVHVAPGANLSGNVHLKKCCWVGAGAVVNQGSSALKRVIGEKTIVGSGSVVISDCEGGAVYAGVPAKRIK